MKRRSSGFRAWEYVLFAAVTVAALFLCVCVGSVSVPLKDTVTVIVNTVLGKPVPETIASPTIISAVRLPRVICVALTGAALSISGVAMQGLLRNPLADGSTLGVSSGASLGAIMAIAFGISFPNAPVAGSAVMAMIFAFLSLLLILGLAYKLDYSLSTNTIILIGVIFSMFVSSIINFIVAFAGDKVKDITFWMMGSFAGSSYREGLFLLGAFVIFGGIIFAHANELNAFAMGEDNARHIGVNVKRVKLLVLIAVSALVGVTVSVGGTIGFVGLVTPHMVRMITGPNHRRLLPACAFGGATFLLLCDLVSRIILNPIQLPIGVVTSLIGAVLFVYIFYTSRRKGDA